MSQMVLKNAPDCPQNHLDGSQNSQMVPKNALDVPKMLRWSPKCFRCPSNYSQTQLYRTEASYFDTNWAKSASNGTHLGLFQDQFSDHFCLASS